MISHSLTKQILYIDNMILKNIALEPLLFNVQFRQIQKQTPVLMVVRYNNQGNTYNILP